MILDKESNNYLKEIIAEFKQAPYHNQYQNIIKPQWKTKSSIIVFMVTTTKLQCEDSY